MMTDRELMQQALDQLDECESLLIQFEAPNDSCVGATAIRCGKVADALRERLAQAEQEPVVYMYPVDLEGIQTTQTHAEVMTKEFANLEICIPLYAAPRSWQGLTDDEIEEAGYLRMLPYSFARAIEAKLKEKNNGQ